MGGIGGSRHGVGGIGSSRGSSISSVRGVVGDARGIGSNWGSSSVDIAGSNGGRSDRGCNSDRSCRRNSHRGGSRGNGNWGSSSNRASSRDDQQVGGGGVTVGDGIVLSSDCLRSKRAAVAHTVAIPESSGVPACLGLAVPIFGAARG